MVTTYEMLKGMSVIASDGVDVGHVETSSATQIKLIPRAGAVGRNRRVPMAWVVRVDSHVHLNRPSAEVLGTVPSESAATIPKGVLRARSPFFWILVVAFGTVLLLLVARACVGSYDRTVVTVSLEAGREAMSA